MIMRSAKLPLSCITWLFLLFLLYLPVSKWLPSCTVNAFRRRALFLCERSWLTPQLSQNSPTSRHINKPTLTLSRATFSFCIRNLPSATLPSLSQRRCSSSSSAHRKPVTDPTWLTVRLAALLMQVAESWDGERFIKYKGPERNSCPSKCHRQEIILLRNKWADYGNMWAYA